MNDKFIERKLKGREDEKEKHREKVEEETSTSLQKSNEKRIGVGSSCLLKDPLHLLVT